MRSDETGWRFHANLSDSHSIHAHGETGRGATQFWPFQALRSAWVMSLHFPDGCSRGLRETIPIATHCFSARSNLAETYPGTHYCQQMPRANPVLGKRGDPVSGRDFFFPCDAFN